MIIALTGSSGTVGKELKPFLLKLDHQVLEISSSTPSNGKDIFSYQDLQNEKLNISPDLVIHLASLNSNLNKKDIEEEILITKNVLKIMRSTNCSKIIFLARLRFMVIILMNKKFILSAMS